MQAAALLSLASALTAAHGGRCAPVAPRAIECSQPFSANQRDETFAIHLPETAPRRAVLFLHGAGRDHLTLVRSPATAAALARSASVLVFPRGGPSWWVDSPGSRYEGYALELMDRVAAVLRIPAKPDLWSAAGWSMGGFGSLRLASRRPERFGAWGGILALADFPNPSYPPEHNHSVPSFLTTAENPLPLAARLRDKRLWFATGDAAFDRRMNEALHRRLGDLGIAHEFHTVTGRHEFRVVEETLGPMLAFLDRDR